MKQITAGVSSLHTKLDALKIARASIKLNAQSLSAVKHKDAHAESRKLCLILEGIETDLECYDRDLKLKGKY